MKSQFFRGLEDLDETICDKKGHKYTKATKDGTRGCARCTCISYGMKKGRKISVKQFMKELEELEPKNMVDYIFRGSALNQWRKKHENKLS